MNDMNNMDKIMYNPIYVALIIIVIIPINIVMILNGSLLFGILLLLCQFPWLYRGFAGEFKYTLQLMGVDK